MAFGPGTGSTDLSRKGSLTARWPEADSLKGIEIGAEVEPQPANPDAAVFALGSKEGERLRHNFSLAVQHGTVEKSSVLVGAAADSARVMAEKQKEERRKQDENLRFMRMMKALEDRLAELEREMADIAIKLRAKYGQDFIGGMAAAYLSEEELGQAQSEEERLKLLAEEFLDRDGNIKEKFKGSDEAEYIKRWNEAQEIRPIVEKNNNASPHTENKKTLDSDVSSLKFFDIEKAIDKLEDKFSKDTNNVNKQIDISSLNNL